MRGLGWMGVVVLMAAGCDDMGAVGATGSPLTASELEQRLMAGPERVELKLRAAGQSELVIRVPDLEERVQGWVMGFDAAAGTLAIGELGVVQIGAGARFRTEEESSVSQAVWTAELEGALAAGVPIFVRATRLAGVAPQAPEDPTFIASDLRIEDSGDTKIELDVDADNFSSAPPTLVLLGRSHDLSSVRMSDDNGDDGIEDESGDDNGNDGVEDESGDDNGNDGVEDESGDDNGNDGVEDESGDDS